MLILGDAMNTETESVGSEVRESEQKYHSKFLSKHIDFINETLAGLQEAHSWMKPVGCPSATPAKLARRKASGDKCSCLWDDITYKNKENCACRDPLLDSQEPLDAFAAAILTPEKSVSEMYYTHKWRKIVSQLRDNVGSWDKIAKLEEDELEQTLEESTDTKVPKTRAVDLINTLQNIQEHRWIDNLTFREISSVSYESIKDFLMEVGDISEQKAYWLVLTAFDKPVFPTDEKMSSFLEQIGLIESGPEGVRFEELEEKLVDRQIPALNRAISGHIRYCRDCSETSCSFEKFSLKYREKRQQEEVDEPNVADLFSGAGGISHGFERAGFNIEFALDKDEYATDTYRLNHPSMPHERVKCDDITCLLDNEDLVEELNREIDVVVGGPPCQALSKAGYRARLANDEEYSVLEDPRTKLYHDYVKAIQKIEPKAFIMENVEGLISEIGDTGVRVADQVVDTLEDRGYIADYGLVNTANLGIPQKRRRAVVIGFKKDIVSDRDKISEIFKRMSKSSRETPNLRQGLAKLPMIKCGEGGNVVPGTRVGPDSEYLDKNGLSHSLSINFNHQAREHPMEKDRKLFGEVMDPGDTGWEIKYEKEGGKYGHLIDYNVGTKEDPEFNDKYRMLRWNDPAPTVVAHLAKDANNFILPDYYKYVRKDKEKSDPMRNRGVTPREAARLQSFPDDFIFLGPFTSQFRQVGNAVPPLMGQRLAEELEELMSNESDVKKAKISE